MAIRAPDGANKLMVIVEVDVVAKSDKSYYLCPSPAPSADMAAVKIQNRLVATEVLISWT